MLKNLHLNITYNKGNAYFEFTCATEDIENNKEVLLLDGVGIIVEYFIHAGIDLTL